RLSRRDQMTNKSMYECKKSELYDMVDIPTYEEVTTNRRQHGEKYRLVVLVGEPGHLLPLLHGPVLSSPAHFRCIRQWTGVSMGTLTGDHLISTSFSRMRFVEHGEYKGNYYGTSLDSVRSVLSKNKVCLLDVQPHTIKHLRTSEFKPYVIFVKPPPIERLRESRKNAKEMICSAQLMENQYGHLFEKVIVNDELMTAFSELKMTLKKLETETLWVPVNWTHS
ncbi:MPP7 protein, partial [Amia calva]|nr:MPP7 protein [Amia calva]